jgi:protein-tyrosine-phosphatase
MVAWCDSLMSLIETHAFAAVLPLDDLAHEACSALCPRWPSQALLVAPRPPQLRVASDRSLVLQHASAAGWRTLPTLFLAQGTHLAVAPALPCIVRPNRACAIVGDEPAHYSVRTTTTAAMLDAKLRDDLPRGPVLLQHLIAGERFDVLLSAEGGMPLSMSVLYASGVRAGRFESAPADIVGLVTALTERLAWTGMLRLECSRDGEALTLHDLHLDPGTALTSCCRAGFDLPGLLIDRLLPGTAPSSRSSFDHGPALADAWLRVHRVSRKVLLRARTAAWRSPRAAVRGLHREQSILFVCKGNINRSLVAEQCLRAAGFTSVASAALLGMTGRRPSASAEQYVADQLGMAADGLRSRGVEPVLRGADFDLVVCFERRHGVELVKRHPELRGRVHLLTALAGERGSGIDIPDPHGGSPEDHRRCFDRIARLLHKLVADAGEPARALAAAAV